MDFTAFAVGGAMVMTGLSLVKHLRGGKTGDALTLVVLVAIGVGVAFLMRASDFAAGIDVGSVTLNNLNAASTVLFGYALGSAARVAYEATNRKVNDEPKLFTNPVAAKKGKKT